MDILQILLTGVALLLTARAEDGHRKEKRGIDNANLYTSAILGGHSIAGLSQSIEIPIQQSLPIAIARPVKYFAVPVPISYYQAPVSYPHGGGDSYASAGPQVSHSHGGGGGGYTNSNGGDSYSNGGYSYSNGGDSYSNGGYSYSNGGESYSNGGDSYSNGGDSFSNGGGSYSHGDSYAQGGGQIVHGPLRGIYIPSSEGGLYGHSAPSSGWKGAY